MNSCSINVTLANGCISISAIVFSIAANTSIWVVLRCVTLLTGAQNSALFSLIGTTYGGDGQSTFALPNLQSRVPVGVGQGRGLSPYVLGQQAGTENVTIILPQIPAYSHPAQASAAPINVSSSNEDTGAAVNGSRIATPGTVSRRDFTATLGYNSASPDTTLYPATGGPANITVGIEGGSQPHDNVQPYLALNFIICTQGILPPRN